MTNEFKECIGCHLPLPIDSFRMKKYTRADGSAGYYRYNNCRSCDEKLTTERRKRRYDLVYAFAETLGCEECGEKDIRALTFDHVDRSTKHQGVSDMISNGRHLSAIWAEIGKCRILCANCHSKHTAEQLNHYSQQYVLDRESIQPEEKEAKLHIGNYLDH